MSASVLDSNKAFSATNNAAFVGTNAFTASGWFRLTTNPSAYGYFFGNNNGATKGWVLYEDAAGDLKPAAAVSDGTDALTAIDTTAFTIDTWVFVAVTYDATNIRYYRGTETVSPVLITTTAQSGNMGTATDNLTFGFLDADATYRALLISDCRIYNNTVRSQADIQSDYLRRLNGNETGLTDYWKFNETSGNTATNSTSARNATATAASWSIDNPAFPASGTGFFAFM